MHAYLVVSICNHVCTSLCVIDLCNVFVTGEVLCLIVSVFPCVGLGATYTAGGCYDRLCSVGSGDPTRFRTRYVVNMPRHMNHCVAELGVEDDHFVLYWSW